MFKAMPLQKKQIACNTSSNVEKPFRKRKHLGRRVLSFQAHVRDSFDLEVRSLDDFVVEDLRAASMSEQQRKRRYFLGRFILLRWPICGRVPSVCARKIQGTHRAVELHVRCMRSVRTGPAPYRLRRRLLRDVPGLRNRNLQDGNGKLGYAMQRVRVLRRWAIPHRLRSHFGRDMYRVHNRQVQECLV